MQYMMIYYDALEEYQLLTDEQFGKLIRAGLIYARDGTETELSAPESYLFPGLKMRITRDADKYQETCEKRRESALKRWNQQTEPVEEMQVHANACKRTEYKYKVKDKDKDKSKVKSESKDKARAELIEEGYTEAEIDDALSRISGGTGIRNLTAYVRKTIDETRKAQTIGKHVSAQNYEQRESGEWYSKEGALKRFEEQCRQKFPEDFDQDGRPINE